MSEADVAETPAPDFLHGGGEMGERLRAFDWASTELGPPERWPQSLRTAMRLMLNTGHPVYIFWGAEGLCFYNDAYRPSLGPERHPGSLGRPARKVWAEIWPLIGGQIDQVMSGGGATWNENRLIPMTRNGRLEDVYWTYSYSPIDDETAPSGIGGVLTLCTETTAQVEMSRRLALSDERLQIALSSGRGVGVWDWDVAADRLVADERFARLYGADPARAAAGAPIAEFFGRLHPDDLPRVQARVADALATAETFSEEYRLVQPDGQSRWVLAEGRVVLDEHGSPSRFPGVSFDITDRKLAEEALVRRGAEFRAMADNIAQLAWMADPSGSIYWYNRRWYDYTGTTFDEMHGWGWQAVHHPDHLDRVVARFRHAIEAGEPWEDTFPLRGADGGYRWFLSRALPIRDDAGAIVRWFGTNTDVTEQLETERELTELTQTLETRVEARTRDLMRAEETLRQAQKMEAVGQLTGGIAHDFNNLLTGVTGNLELLQMRVAQGRFDAVERHVAAASGAARRAAALTQRLLAFSRRQTLDPKPANVNRLVADMEELIRRSVGPAVTVETVGAAGLWPVMVDVNQLENALLNLCINARDAMPDGGRITIETANKWLDDRASRERDLPPGQYVSLCVTDTGTGMSPDLIERVFEPFFTTKPLGQGTGLGLSMIYGFVRQSDGQVRIYSEPGQGTTMCLYLPRYHGSADSEPVAATPAPDAEGGGRTILVVDDEPTVRQLVAEVLEEAGFRVIEAADGATGLAVLASSANVDLLVTDVGLPGGMNGRQLADAALVRRPELRILFITGFAENAAVGNGHLEPGMELLTKPFSIEALKAKVKGIVD